MSTIASRLRITRAGLAACALALLAGCPGHAPAGDASVDAVGPPSCVGDNALLPLGDGGTRCVPVGADAAAAVAAWPDTTDATGPIVYVQAGAVGGTGTIDAPFGDLAVAVAARPDAHTFALAAGTYSLTAPLALAGTVAVIGSGASVCIVAPAADAIGLDVTDPAAVVAVAGLTIRYASPSTAGAAIALAPGAHATLAEVAIEDAWVGVDAVGATLSATGLSVRRAGYRGLALRFDDASVTATTATLTRALVRDGAGDGILVDRSQLTLDTSYAGGNRLSGLSIIGGAASPGDTLTSVALVDNGGVGLRVQGDAATVHAALITVIGTRVLTGVPGGDGIFVGAGGTLVLDQRAAPWTASDEGTTSLIAYNGRTGVLASGDPDAGTPGGAVDIYGARIASNAGPGVFLQERAQSNAIGYARIDGNGALGVGVASQAHVALFPCNGIHTTHSAVLETVQGPLMLGDGLSLAQGTAASTQVLDNDFSDNDRFGAVFAGVTVVLGGNHGSGNAFGVGNYGAELTGDTTLVTGRSAAPTPPVATAQGRVSLAP